MGRENREGNDDESARRAYWREAKGGRTGKGEKEKAREEHAAFSSSLRTSSLKPLSRDPPCVH